MESSRPDLVPRFRFPLPLVGADRDTAVRLRLLLLLLFVPLAFVFYELSERIRAVAEALAHGHTPFGDESR